jgi:hypothetical protein
MMLERARLLTGHYSKRSNSMSNKTGSPVTPVQAASTSNPRRPIKSGAAMAALLKGCRNIPVMFVNPKWETNTLEDRWIVVLPIAGSFVPVQTGLQGYQPKADLRQMAQAILMKPERALEMLVDMPDITDTESVKQIAMLIPVLG